MKLGKLLCCLLIVIVLLSACTSATKSLPTVTVTQIAFPSVPTFTLTPSPIDTPTSPTLPNVTNTVAPKDSLPISFAPNEMQMVYGLNGILYFQDGSNPPFQLTYGGEDQPLFFSEDGKRVFFLRGIHNYTLYSINIDGSQEKKLVDNNQLLAFDADYDESITPCGPEMVPHKNLLLFSTCSHPANDPTTQTVYNDDLFIVNTETNQVKKLLSRGMVDLFYVSPDGNMLAVDGHNSINIFDFDGEILYPNVATYPHSDPIPTHSFIYWVENSSELILALPINTLYDSSLPPEYAIWRYSLDTRVNVQVDLDPLPMSFEPIRVSPDGNWVTYNNRNERYFYLGNLLNGGSRAYEMALPYQWSPDSIHFVYQISQPGGSDLYLASINADPVFVGKGEFIGWLDTSHYVYYANKTFFMGEIGVESVPILIGNTSYLYSYGSLIFNIHL